jgi:iron complex outermembrane receptor protein
VSLRSLLLTTTFAASTVLPMAALAAEAPAETVKEVIITAQRRSTNLQDTAISVSAVTADQIADSGIRRNEDFASAIPNVYVDERNLRTQGIVIRGISADLNNPGLDQGVGIFVDGVYMGRATVGNSNLFDLERVEVLRGPQGSLYGKNTIAGAVNYITQKPTDRTRAEADISYGNYSAVTGAGLVSGAILPEKLFASLALSVDKRDGLTTNTATKTKEDDINGTSGRLVVRALPATGVEVVVRADVARDRTHSGTQDIYNNGVFTGSPLADANPWDRKISQDRNSIQNRDVWGVSGEVNWTTSYGVWTSLTAQRGFKWFNMADNDFTALDMLSSGIQENQRQFSQEVRFASKATENFNYVAGVYYFHQNLNTDSQAIIGPALGIYPTDVTADIYGLVKTDSYAGFAHGEYKFAPHWSVVGGIRYTKEDKSVVQHVHGDPWGVLAATTSPRTITRSEDNVSPNLSLNYKPQANQLFYASVSQGYKSGGFNVFSITPTDNAEYRPEHVTNFELGSKSELFGRRLRLNTSIYYLDYKDLQVNQLILVGATPQFQTSNAAKARSQGAEVELQARPLRGLELSATFGYDDAKFTSYKGATKSGADYTHHILPRAPKETASFAAQYQHPVANDLDFIGRVEASFRSKVFFGADNALSQGSVDLLNARIGLQKSKAFGLYLWGRNLGDKKYAIDREAGVIIPGQVTQAVGAPRTFGVEVRVAY